MIILGINTCFKGTQVGLLIDDEIKELYGDKNEQHSVNLLNVIDTILSDNKIAIKDLDAIAVVIGPGSFTGIRIGISAVKALSYASKLPIIAINSLDLMLSSNECDVAMIKGVSNEMFIKKRNEESKLITINEFMDNYKGETVTYNADDENPASIKSMAYAFNVLDLMNLAKKQYIDKNFINEFKLEPLYLRLSQAEVEKNGRK